MPTTIRLETQVSTDDLLHAIEDKVEGLTVLRKYRQYAVVILHIVVVVLWVTVVPALPEGDGRYKQGKKE